ncbi:MAG: hypothetical protein HY720_10715 [Planctomycetes bacterium]|nr:hypothetical protein [Planctomycetota bacterium]
MSPLPARRVALFFSLLAVLSPVLSADDPCEAAAARAGRVLSAVKRIYQETEELRVEETLASLRDEDWLVRRYAIVRLRATGLPADLGDALLGHAVPGGPGIDEEAEREIERIEAWAKERDEEPAPGPVPTTDLDAAIGVSGIAREFLSRGLPGEEARLMVDLTVALVERMGEEDRRLAGQILETSLGRQARGELDVPPERKILEAAEVALLCDWWWKNRSYAYHHPRARGLRVDLAAREAGQPTDDYRREHPWGAGEGPDGPADGEDSGAAGGIR